MKLIDNLKTAFRSLMRRKLNCLLSLAGIVIGVAALVIVVCVGFGSGSQIRRIYDSVGSRVISVAVNGNAAEADRITFRDVSRLKEKVSGVECASPVLKKSAAMRGQGEDINLQLMFGNCDLEKILHLSYFDGRFFSQDEFNSAMNVALIDRRLAKEFFGYENAVGQRIEVTAQNKRMRLTVIGIVEASVLDCASQDGAAYTVIIPATVLLNTFGGTEAADLCLVKTDDACDADEVGTEIQQLLERCHNNAERAAYVFESLVEHKQLDRVLRLFLAFATAVAVIALLTGGAGIMNMMLVTVTQRTSEIGIRRAVGASMKEILKQFLFESVVLCLCGGLGGVVFGVAGALPQALF